MKNLVKYGFNSNSHEMNQAVDWDSIDNLSTRKNTVKRRLLKNLSSILGVEGSSFQTNRSLIEFLLGDKLNLKLGAYPDYENESEKYLEKYFDQKGLILREYNFIGFNGDLVDIEEFTKLVKKENWSKLFGHQRFEIFFPTVRRKDFSDQHLREYVLENPRMQDRIFYDDRKIIDVVGEYLSERESLLVS